MILETQIMMLIDIIRTTPPELILRNLPACQGYGIEIGLKLGEIVLMGR